MDNAGLNKVLIITCTHDRENRIRYIKRCIKVFKKAKNIFWIVVEDGRAIDKKVMRLLGKSGIPYVYLNVFSKSWGNAQKNLGLSYIRDNNLKGIVYTADDDNRYDVRIFDEIRKTKKISVFPVGNLGPSGIERPIVKDGKIVGWDAGWEERKFPIDQGGYAFNAELLHSLTDPIWSYQLRGGETQFIEKIIQSPDELEILCNGCKDLYVWHNDLYPDGFKTKLMKKLKDFAYLYPNNPLSWYLNRYIFVK